MIRKRLLSLTLLKILFVFSNIQIFKDTEIMKGTTGMLKKMHKATLESNLNECCQKVFEALDGEKAKMALDIYMNLNHKEMSYLARLITLTMG